MATVKQAAEALNVSSKKLLNELKKKFPDQAWTLESELPEGFESAAKQHAQEYAEASGVELPKGQLTTTNEAIADSRIVLEAIEYGILEALGDSKMHEMITTAQLNAVRDIQEYQNAYAGVWELFFEQEIAKRDQRSSQFADQLKQSSLALNAQLAERSGKLLQKGQQMEKLREESKNSSQEILKALLG